MAKKEEEKEKPSEEVSTRELLEIIRTQQEDIKNIKKAHNALVDTLSELGDKLEKGAGKGGLGEIATIIKAVAPLIRPEGRSPFHDIGVFTFKQFLRSAMGKKMAKKAIQKMVSEEEEEEEEK